MDPNKPENNPVMSLIKFDDSINPVFDKTTSTMIGMAATSKTGRDFASS